MTTAYHRALATPGATRFVPAAFVGRLPIAMVSIGTILFVHAETGSYGVGGAVAAAGAVGEAVLAPRVGRALDRFGQARVLLVCLVGHVTGLTTLILAVSGQAPRPIWFAASALAGGTLPPIGACVRARWSAKLAGDDLLGTALALEAAIDELVFVLGPTLVTLLAVMVTPAAGLIASLALLTAGTTALITLRESDPGPRVGGTAVRARLLRDPGTRTLILIFLAIGVAFGGVDVSMVAFAREEELAAAGGLLLGLFATGSGISSLFYGARSHVRPLRSRFVRATATMAVGMALPLAGVTLELMIPLALLAGATVSPTLISGNAMVEQMVAAGARTEGFAWLTMAVVSGIAIGSPLAGSLIDDGDAHRGLLVAAGAGVLIGLAATLGRRSLDTRPGEKARATGVDGSRAGADRADGSPVQAG